ncbi:ATP-binding protein [Actinoplanes sp. NPDC049802]|uniref:AlbA family DNA-binding domain-containing protein n=1 Tax=Actinoplanes sp. NPDC049802 TaxID=3154742 RepID=UPI0033D71E6B
MTHPLPVHLGPDLPRWTPRTATDVERAIADGLLRETHWLDVKLEISAGSGANKETARDMASFAIDGGGILVGIREDKQAGTMTVEPVDLRGLPERIDEIARSRCDRPLYVRCHPIPVDAADPHHGLLLIEIPPSAMAPHMVDGRYYGRGDTTKRTLTDPEVERLQAARSMRHLGAGQIIAREIARDPVPPAHRERGHLYVVAQPLATPRDWLTEQIEEREVSSLLRSTVNGITNEFSPGLRHASNESHRAEGVAFSSYGLTARQLTVSPHQDRNREAGTVDIEVGDDGRIAIFCGRATDFPRGGDQQFILDMGIAHHVRGAVNIAANLGFTFGYGGRWLLAVGVTGLQGRYSTAAMEALGSVGTQPFTTDQYQESTEAVTAELRDRPGTVTHRLVRRLLRGLGVTADRYADLLKD